MLTSAIIARFNLQIDDASELSSDEELALANEVYSEVCNDRPWEWLKSTFSGSTSVSVPYVALSSDFVMFSPNKENRSVVFIGTDYQEYSVVPFSSRREHLDADGFCYLDMVNRRLYFTKQPTEVKTVEYDYIKKPTALTTATEPIITTDSFGNMIAYGMAKRFPSIEQADKATSYARDNDSEYNHILTDLQIEDAHNKLGY
jgi:hypothetical protein